MDKNLAKVKNHRDFFYKVATKSDENDPNHAQNWNNYVEYRQKFDSLRREMLKDDFRDKTASNFKQSNQYWKFYSNFVPMKKSNNECEFPEYVISNGVKVNNSSEIPDIFNAHFTNISSNSLSEKSDCSKFIDKTFKKLKDQNKVNIPGFNFIPFNESNIIEAIKDLSNTSSQGVSGIPTKNLKRNWPLSLFNPGEIIQ